MSKQVNLTYIKARYESHKINQSHYSSTQLDRLMYPRSNRPKDYYLAIEIKKTTAPEFENVRWDFKELEAYKEIQREVKNPYTKAGMPFTVSLTALMKKKLKP